MVFVLFLMTLLVTSSLATVQRPSSTAAELAIPGERWTEIDLYWFEQKDIAGSVKAFWDRFQPLYAGVQGYRGLILNVGWTVACVMEWSGDLNQAISLPHGSGQQHWVDEKGPLRGTTAERQQEARARFARPQVVPHHGYAPWTYGDLKKLAMAIREEAEKRGISDFKVGMLNYAWTNAYGEVPAWVRRHHEAFTDWPSLPPAGRCSRRISIRTPSCTPIRQNWGACREEFRRASPFTKPMPPNGEACRNSRGSTL